MFSKFADLGVEPVRQAETCNWVSAIFRKFEALVRRHQAGKLRLGTKPRAVVPGEKPARKIINKPTFRVPRRWGWLLATGKHHTAYHHGQIRMVLERPEIAELLAVSPQAVRMVRPLCRAFGVDLPWAMDKTSGITTPRLRRKRAKRPVFPEDIRCPLPRGVKAWVRKQREIERAIKLKHELIAKMGKGRPW